MDKAQYYNRDLSWLKFNERVMDQAIHDGVPLIERLRFLSIYSSNLDEFYRVRIPVLHALKKISKDKSVIANDTKQTELLQEIDLTISSQLNKFGEILQSQLIPEFKKSGINLLYGNSFPDHIQQQATEYFLAEVLAFLQPVDLDRSTDFFPSNNNLYFIIHLWDNTGNERLMALNIPSNELPRFKIISDKDESYVLFLDDIIRYNLDKIFNDIIEGCYSIKITRDAELDLVDDYPGDVSEEIEKQLKKRDFGLATRFLYQSNMPEDLLIKICRKLQLQTSSLTVGGRYHNLKDFSQLNLNVSSGNYDHLPAIHPHTVTVCAPLLTQVQTNDILISTPYHSYDPVLRFFNEAAINIEVSEIYVTLYRVASDSKIVHALISAAKNGKKVTVIIELKARFDEANNLRWAKRMKQVGVEIIYSINTLKVHAKIALVKCSKENETIYTGLLATGNFNEQTARFYTDHVLFTANAGIIKEMELLFEFLLKRKRPDEKDQIDLKHLIVAQFNLPEKFIELIDREIANAQQGLPAAITLKMNNLEERTLISKLYEASQQGVKISLIIRGICCLIPGRKGMSENISVKRIVDRYLEHGRVFIFHNNDQPEVFLGSADWMNRNVYNRVEVCFPVYANFLKKEIIDIVELQLADNIQGVRLDENLDNVKIRTIAPPLQSQMEIYKLLNKVG